MGAAENRAEHIKGQSLYARPTVHRRACCEHWKASKWTVGFPSSSGTCATTACARRRGASAKQRSAGVKRPGAGAGAGAGSAKECQAPEGEIARRGGREGVDGEKGRAP